MRNETRIKYTALAVAIAQLSGVANAAEKFSVAPSVQQKLENRIQLASDFLTRINMVGVVEQQGEKLGLGATGTIAGTTDTTAKDRVPTDPTDLTGNKYVCQQINFDTALRYAKLDMWAKFADFQLRVRDAIVKQQARDRIMIGFNGVERAPTSNRVTNPKLQDVAKGWLQKYREDAPERVMNKGAVAGEIRVGRAAGADYDNLDALVMDAVNHLVDEVYADDPELVVICGRSLMADKYFPLVNKDQDNSEKLAADLIISQKRIGGLQAVQVPFFPANALLITRLDNLSIYYQDGARRRAIIDNPKRDQVENYESSNDDYVVEDYRAGCLIENIKTEWA
ncbi:phage major capsid protein, P2 family [Massilia sp. YIM B02763]|uniref:phage major capsid protein, P2 family n=1 Tax=Massilia sp. YIM B02763 TaxID=3050130 RepID=UPI0025B6F1C6|nr:phage major capsid protein, P2 family [Massilia sp. YIM B02763]MDN4056326.1 phage major capsid protein, P2 family [Massilia sp. YIM B02763]